MESNYLEFINTYFEKYTFSERLMTHTIGTVSLGEELAHIYGENITQIRIACLYHDYAKEWTNEKQNQYILSNSMSSELIDNRNIAHGKIAAHFLEKNWSDELPKIKFSQEVINAISFHTTGKSNMKMNEMIVYVADAIEPNRNYSGVEELREIAKKDLHRACGLIINNTMNKLKTKGIEQSEIHHDTVEGFNYYCK